MSAKQQNLGSRVQIAVAALVFAAVIAGVAYVGTGAFVVTKAAFSPAGSETVTFAPGEIVRDGPLYEVRNPEVDYSPSLALGYHYDFAPVRFKNHRGKWVVMVLLLGPSGDDHNDAGMAQNYKFVMELRQQLRDLPEYELWLVRMNRAPLGLPITGMFKECTFAPKAGAPRPGPNSCYDRFFYAAYHAGADHLYFQPQAQWLSDMRKLNHDKNWASTTLPYVMAVDPDGRMYTPGANGAVQESSGAKAISRGLHTLIKG